MPALPRTVLDDAVSLPRNRWLVAAALGLIFAASSGDRAVLGLLKTTLAGELALSQTGYAQLVVALLLPYAAAMALAGGVINRFGTRAVLTFCLLTASTAIALCGSAQNYRQIIGTQVVLGFAQAGVAPAVACVIMREFTATAQASAYSLVNALQSSATILCPAFVAVTTILLGWRYAFYLPAVTGSVFALVWWIASARWVTARVPHVAPSWSLGAAARELWQRPSARRLVLARIVSDPLWFFFQFWLPSYLREHIGLSLADVGSIAWIPPLASVLGVLAASALSDRLVARGAPPTMARARPLLWIAALAPAAAALPLAHAASPAIALAVLVHVLCATWLSLSAILLGTLVPRELLAPSLGVMNALGCLAGVAFSFAAGSLIACDGYRWPFWIGALLHPLAALLLRPLGRDVDYHGKA